MTDLTPNHPAVQVGCQAAGEWTESASVDAQDHITLALHMTAACIIAALPHLTADDLHAHLVRDIQVRTIRATARAATYEEDGTPWDYDWDRAAVSAWLNELADNIERDGDA